jgi:NAD(P)-dependent dehydrogenase (short-subunit alcohol dehydrogenase family)
VYGRGTSEGVTPANEMADRVALVTGATRGLGRVVALELARQGATVLLVGRDRDRTLAAAEACRAQRGGGAVDPLVADLSSLAEVRRLGEEVRRRYPRLHVLINNAGAIFARRQVTVDGFERTFALNHLAPFLLTDVLLETLKASAPSRIVNVSSRSHRRGAIDFRDLQGARRYGLGGRRAYSQSKLANVLFTYELARRLDGTGVAVNAVHPGVVATDFGRNNGGLTGLVTRLAKRLFRRFVLTPEEGADTILYLASSPEVEGVSGKYWVRRRPVPSSAASYDESTQRRLWDVSARLTGVAAPAQG